MTDAQVKARYQSCSDGYYSGPRPGRTRYTKDDYVWAVTPDFAKRYCMPPEFISTELKGADAVAFHMVKEGAEQCGYGGQKEVCSRRQALGLEFYFSSAIKLPSISDTKFSTRALYMVEMSAHVVTDKRPYANSQQWLDDKPGGQNKFTPNSMGLVAVKEDKAIWPVAAFGEMMYIEDLLPGYNFLSVEGNAGNFEHPGLRKLDPKRFAFVMRHPWQGSPPPPPALALADYSYVIELPQSFIEKMRVQDGEASMTARDLFKRATSTNK
ncbi:hypothetical protein [Cupriavidus metallidurans]|uniref:hypothetical protein n=1 Tax=Cupriavidus metallidurans TaxID=119219 RepID=UPI0012685D49|nr:hypothetical protein [Cupriavidus metallidurans]